MNQIDERASAEDELLTPRDFEQQYGIPVSTSAAWRCDGGGGPAFIKPKIGRSVYYQRRDI